jgi:hypothetical protein
MLFQIPRRPTGSAIDTIPPRRADHARDRADIAAIRTASFGAPWFPGQSVDGLEPGAAPLTFIHRLERWK